MIKLFPILFLFVGLTTTGVAQTKGTGVVRGKLLDSVTNNILSDATISICNSTDSTIITSSTSKQDGSFVFERLPFGSYLLKIDFQGYNTITRSFVTNKKNPDYNASNLFLSPAPKDLGVVVVKSSPVMLVKGDTTEFSASRFKTRPNATAEDLLKKLPGMEVDKEGGVKAQGEQVTKILVDGKPFFGTDIKMATKNLPTDIIDKVQVIDALTDQSAFSGFDDGTQEKVINIITKKDRRKGYFGRGSAAVGDDGRYGVNINLNRFNGNRKISLIGQANNTSQENLSTQDIVNLVNAGGFGRNGFGNFNSGQAGIARSYEGGLNYNDVLSKKTEISGNYKYGNSNVINRKSSLRETFVQSDSSLFNDNISYGNNRNVSQRFNFELDHKFDSMNSILIRPSYNYQQTGNYSESDAYLTKGKTVSQKEVRTINNSLTDGSDFNNRILFRHRFAKRGRSVSVNFDQQINKSHSDRTALNYTNNYFNNNGITDTTNRLSDISGDSKNATINVSYTEPVGAKGQLEVHYNYNNNLDYSSRKTNTFNASTHKYDITDTALSNDFENSNISQRSGFNYKRQVNKQFSYTLGFGMQHTEVSSDNKTKSKTLTQSFNNLVPSATFQFRKNRTNNIRFSYRGNTRQPGLMQLQDVVDNSNLLNITRGNPALKQEFNNNFNFRYTRINNTNFSNFIIRVNANVTQNKISNAVTVNTGTTKMIIDNVEIEPLAQYTKPVNLNGAYIVNGYINYGFPLKRPKSNINFSTNLSGSRDVNMVNNITSYTRNYIIAETARFNMNLLDQFDLNFSSSSTYNIARNTLKPQQNRNYFTQSVSVETAYSTKNGWVITSDFDYTTTKGQAAGYNQSLPLLGASISKLMFAKKQGEIKLSVNDLLNQNKSITRNVGENYIEDVRSAVLQRYFLLTFIYHLRKFSGN